MSGVLTLSGVFSSGYGIIPKMVMKDRSLDAEAKAIYAYLASYAGAGKTAYPSVKMILEDLGIGRERYYKYLGQLTRLGYVKIDKVKSDDNKFTNNTYELVVDIRAQEKEIRQTQGERIEKTISAFIGYFQTRYYEINGEFERPITPRMWKKIKMQLGTRIAMHNLTIDSLEAKADRFFAKQKGKGIKTFMGVFK